jgi:para-aminobenzoate synthetase/4-amino-4-deoxychorismate lyase
VRTSPAGDPFEELPLAWFGIFEDATPVPPLRPPNAAFGVWRWRPSPSQPDYEEQVERIRGYIRAGETYQVNHTIRLRGRFAGTDRAFYAALALAQRGSHAAYVDLGRYRILCASPELLFSLDADGALVTRPMKGTAPRGRWPAEDRARAYTLAATEKERAENAMIVDLLRNDMGRISDPGSVRPERLFEVERYETVWQMTSTIRSRLREGLGLPDVFGALFPSGSVTGAPKVRSMQIIAELETLPRGIYCGAIGWAAPVGSEGTIASFNVAIRTVVLDTRSETAEYGVGGGITFDSDPAREHAECLAKSRVLTERRPEFDLLESLAFRDRTLLWPERHLDRMEASAAYFGFAFDRNRIARELDTVVAGLRGDHKVRLLLARDGAIRAESEPIPPLLPEDARPPLRVAIDDEPVDSADIFLFHKTTNRAGFDRRRRRHGNAGEVILVNERGEITEACTANVAVLLNGAWLTPPLDSGCLAGIYRGVLLEEGRIEEGVVPRSDLERADAIALLNSVRLWQPSEIRPG